MGTYKKRLVLVLAAVIFIIAVPATIYFAGTFGNDTQYVMYIGTNDKDIYMQLIPTDEAKAIVNEICARHVGGYTVSTAEGGWVDGNGILTQETTLIYVFTNASETQMYAIMDEAIAALNQSSILIEKRYVTSTFYGGKEFSR